jgi:asparagine synthase (glutamine-hydrolysing)
MFGSLDARYFVLIDRSSDLREEIDWSGLDREGVFERFQQAFNSEKNVGKEAYFDCMTHFDFKYLLPALLQVEDRMSMAHGLESRVPMLDHKVVELAATVPPNVKFQNGKLKHFLRSVFQSDLPREISDRRDKMGFPVPLKEWFTDDLRDFVFDVFKSNAAMTRPHLNSRAVVANLGTDEQYSRKMWGLLSLELWHQLFHDQAASYRNLLHKVDVPRIAVRA